MKVRRTRFSRAGLLALLLLAAGVGWAQTANNPVPGVVDGVIGAVGPDGPVFLLTARNGYISTPDGNSVFVWGFVVGDGPVQYPGPTLLVNQGSVVTVELTNELPVPVSIVFPGQSVAATGVSGPTADGVLTREAWPLTYGAYGEVSAGGTVRYRFTAGEAGTYEYNTGTRPDLQVDMGLFGALIVRPADFNAAVPETRTAYGTLTGSEYDVEYLFLLSDLDPVVHRSVQYGDWDLVDTAAFLPNYWFINGRAAPDTMFPPYASWLPTQPYNSMPMMEPAKKLLMRVIGAGRDLHPFHHHGNHARVIARDGRLLDTGAGLTPVDLSYEVFTVQSVPGQTVDALFTWSGAELGWDIYGHASAADPLEPGEYAPDHGKPFPVVLPEPQDITFGGFWSGSPFLGAMGALPPGEGGLNPWAGFVYMWHSHTEREMTNNDIFPGGMMTMLIVAPPGAME